MAISEKLIDKRIVARNIKKGMISSDDYQQMLSELPDCADNIYKSEETDQEEGERASADEASSEIKTTEAVATQPTVVQPLNPVVEPQVTSAEEPPAPGHETRQQPAAPASVFGSPQPASNQPESKPDPDKPPFGHE